MYNIRSFNEGAILTENQINEIVDKICSHHKEQKAPCRVNCERIIEDYAFLMSAIEEAAEGRFSSIQELKDIGKKDEKEEATPEMDKSIKISDSISKEGVARKQKIKGMVCAVTGTVLAVGIGLIAARSVSNQKQTEGECVMNDLMKGLVIMAILMYIVSPVDAVPGPVDDIIVLLLGIASQKKLAEND